MLHRTTKPLRFPPSCIVKVKQDFIDLCSKGHLHFQREKDVCGGGNCFQQHLCGAVKSGRHRKMREMLCSVLTISYAM